MRRSITAAFDSDIATVAIILLLTANAAIDRFTTIPFRPESVTPWWFTGLVASVLTATFLGSKLSAYVAGRRTVSLTADSDFRRGDTLMEYLVTREFVTKSGERVAPCVGISALGCIHLTTLRTIGGWPLCSLCSAQSAERSHSILGLRIHNDALANGVGSCSAC